MVFSYEGPESDLHPDTKEILYRVYRYEQDSLARVWILPRGRQQQADAIAIARLDSLEHARARRSRLERHDCWPAQAATSY